MFPPKGIVQRHFAARREFASIDDHADQRAQIVPGAAGIGAIAIGPFDRGSVAMGRRCRNQTRRREGNQGLHGGKHKCRASKSHLPLDHSSATGNQPPMIAAEKLEQIKARFAFLEAKMAEGAGDDFAALSKEYADLRPVVEVVERYQSLLDDIAQAEDMLDDPEMKDLAAEELQDLRAALPDAEHGVQLALLPKDEADDRSAILEIRAGTGGDEAALFAGDLMRMYQRYAEGAGWRWELIEESATPLGGVKEAVINVKGKGVFARLKFESGVHRVQRVPETESGGRVHTSAATVAVLPEAEEVDIDIPASDLRVDTMRSSGAGGQHVNTTDSAVRIVHVPTGITVVSSEKSQHRNREIAMQVLRTRLYDEKRRAADAERAASRKGQVGSGDRSERIRTYNFPQGRLTDHRINLTLYKLDQVVAGDLDEVIDALIADDQAARLAELDP